MTACQSIPVILCVDSRRDHRLETGEDIAARAEGGTFQLHDHLVDRGAVSDYLLHVIVIVHRRGPLPLRRCDRSCTAHVMAWQEMAAEADSETSAPRVPIYEVNVWTLVC
jgi:hypothetical protein